MSSERPQPSTTTVAPIGSIDEQAIAHGVAGADRWVSDLEAASARTGMNELLLRGRLHRAALGMPGARESAAVFAERIDNPAVLRRVEASSPVHA